MHELHDGRPELHTATNSSGYRNKASFSLGRQFAGEQDFRTQNARIHDDAKRALPRCDQSQLSQQETCAEELNSLALRLQDPWACDWGTVMAQNALEITHDASVQELAQDDDFFVEVALKLTRSGSLGIKRLVLAKQERK